MLYRLGLIKEIAKQYKGNTASILWHFFLKKPLPIKLEKETFYQNTDRSSFYHLVHSFPKIKKLVEAIPSNTEGVIIDGGANNGLFSFHAANKFPKAPIYAFEPYPLLHPILHKNLNHKNVEVILKALARQDGNTTLYISDDSDQIGSVYEENVKAFGSIKNQLKVETISLDSFIREVSVDKIAVLKLDVQGAELDILKGAKEAIDKIEFLILEITLVEKHTFDLIEEARKHFPHHKIINPIGYGADILFSKVPLPTN